MRLNVVESPGPYLEELITEKRPNSFASLAALPSNVEAIEAGLLFSTGLISFAAVVGPSGWGKSHLLEAMANRYAQEDRSVRPITVDAYLNNPARYDSQRVLLLDDVQDLIGKTKKKQQFMLHLERRVKAGRSTALAFTANKPTAQIKRLLPNEREWTIATIAAPAAEERVLLLNQMAAAERLTLSSQLVRILATKMLGDGRTLSGALKRLRLASSTWASPEETLRACGILDPFFSDNCEWDLRLKVLKIAEPQHGLQWKVNSLDLALFTMLSVAGLSEADVARAAHVEPAEAYARSNRFKSRLHDDPELAQTARKFVELVLTSLTQD